MSHRTTVLIFVLLAVLVGLRVRGWASARASAPGSLAAMVALDAEGGPVRVQLRLRGFDTPEVHLAGLLPQRLFDLSDLRASTPDGRTLELDSSSQAVEAGSAVSLYPRIAVRGHDGEPLSDLLVEYSVRPGMQSVQVPCGEERHMGYVSSSGVALSAANVLLLPDRVGLLEFAVVAPPGWTTVSEVPERAEHPSQDELWTWAFASGLRTELVSSGPVRVHDYGTPAPVLDTVRTTIERLAEYLGPPTDDITVALLPRAKDGHRVESPPASNLVVLDMDGPDVGSLRELVRLLVPLWMGSSRFAEEKTTRGRPLLSGLSEYLAQHLPDDLGLANTSAERSIQFTWMRERASASEDFSASTVPLRYVEMVRRLKAPALIEDAMAGRATIAERAALIREWRESDFGRAPSGGVGTGVTSAGALHARIVGRSGELEFEPDWIPAARPTPPLRPDESRSRISLAFTANTAGYLENCGCKVSQDGGVARRATALRALRAENPDLFLLDVGNFAPVERNSSTVADSVSREFEAYLDAMELMRYDAVCIGNFELLAGLSWITNHLRERTLGAISSVAKADGEHPLRRRIVIERAGLRLGVVPLWEKLDHGWSYEAQERNTVGLRFEHGLASIRPLLEDLRDEVDLLVVVGFVAPPTLNELADSGLVDVVLNSFVEWHDFDFTALSSHGDMVVACDLASSYGLNLLTLELDDAGSVAGARLKKIQLDDAVARDPEVQALLDGLYSENVALADDSTLRPLFGWDDFAQGDYVGYRSCKPCHQQEFVQWITTPHASAMKTLRKARRDLNPSCVRCHVLGLGRDDGFRLGAPQPELEGVQCEACHGSGAAHVAEPSRLNIRRSPSQQVCIECHDSKHSDLMKRDFHEVLQSVSHTKEGMEQ